MTEDDRLPPQTEDEVPMAVRQAAETWDGEEPVLEGSSAPFLPSALRRAWRALLRRSAVWVAAIVLDVVWVAGSGRLGSPTAAGLVGLMAMVAVPALAFTGRGRRPGHRLSPRRVAAAALALLLASLILGICVRMVDMVLSGLGARAS